MQRTPSEPPVDPYRRTCRCGHDRAEHHWEPPGYLYAEPGKLIAPRSNDCLARGCSCHHYEGP